jgi:hypothetical protein
MVYLTANQIVTYFPEMTFARERMVIEGAKGAGQDEERTCRTDVTMIEDNSAWTKPCGITCPATHRKTIGDRGVAKYAWSPSNGYEHPSSVQRNAWGNIMDDRRDISDTVLSAWRVMKRCQNTFCSNYKLYNDRAQYINP